MAMAHSVESRFPFLDNRVVEFCNRLPSTLKLRRLSDKHLLRRVSRNHLPSEICRRPKRPYRAPIHQCFFSPPARDYVSQLLSPVQIESAGFFKPAAVRQLVAKIESGTPLGETDDMALAGILSTQLLNHQFKTNFKPAPPIPENSETLKICIGAPRGAHHDRYAREGFGMEGYEFR